MKILHTVESYLPIKHGMSEVVMRISEYLVGEGHDVTVATSYCELRQYDSINGVNVRSFKLSGSSVHGIIGDSDEYINFLKKSDFDIITNFAAQHWATDLCIEILNELPGKKVFVPTGFSGLFNPSFSTYFIKMREWMRQYDMNVFLSNDYRDINFAREFGVKNIMLIPNGASKAEFENNEKFNLRDYLKIPDSTRIILHVGSYTGHKGHEQALRIFLKSKVKESVLLFVGDDFDIGGGYRFVEKVQWFKNFSFRKKFNLGSAKTFLRYILYGFSGNLKNVRIVKLDRGKLVAAYQQSDVFLFPSMIECSPIVLFESIASKTPFLVTNVGNSKEIIEWTNGGKLLPTSIDKNGLSHADIYDSARVLSALINDSSEINRMKEKGYSNWLINFTWEKIALQYEQMYQKLLYEN